MGDIIQFPKKGKHSLSDEEAKLIDDIASKINSSFDNPVFSISTTQNINPDLEKDITRAAKDYSEKYKELLLNALVLALTEFRRPKPTE